MDGDGSGKGTHLSFFLTVMKGEYDALLQWPFKQTVTLMLGWRWEWRRFIHLIVLHRNEGQQTDPFQTRDLKRSHTPRMKL